MSFISWLRNRSSIRSPRWDGFHIRPTAARFRPRLEALEDRTLPTTYYAATTAQLIADITAADTSGKANTIVLTAPTTSPYVLTAANNTADGGTGLPQITKKANLTIVGNGDTIERSTAAGTPSFRLFDVASGGSLTLQNVTLQNGLASGSGTAAGGAVYNHGTVAISNCTLTGNSAGGGGAVNNLGTLTISNSTLSGNSANIGGAIENSGTLTITASTLSGNSGVDGGGAIDNYAKLTISGSTLSGNTSTVEGGAIRNITGQATATITNSTLSGNTAAADGGGIFNAGTGTVTLSGCTLSSDTALAGGAVYSQGPMAVNGCTLSGNSAGDVGGAIYVDDIFGTMPSVTNSVFSNNTPDNIFGYYLGGGNTFQ
jgi:predicted outer membrane repeat protein